MAQKTYTLNLDVNTASLGKLEDELTQINAELKNVDRNSDAFKELSGNAQKVTKELEKVNNEIEGLTADKKFQAADGAIKLMGGSLAAVVGTLGVFGVESEVLGQFEEKAASAIAVAIGFKDVSEGIGQMRTALKGAIPAMKSLNLTMLANPYVAAAAAIVAVGTALYFMATSTTEEEERLEELNNEVERTKGLLDGSVESYEAYTQAQKDAVDQTIADLEATKKLDEARGYYFKGRDEEIAQLKEESGVLGDRLKIYQDSIAATKTLKDEEKQANIDRINRRADIEDEIALYGDEKSESGLLGLKIKLLRNQLAETEDLKGQRDIKRELLLLDQELQGVKAKEAEMAIPQEGIAVDPEGVKIEKAQITAMAIADINAALTTKLSNDAWTQAENVAEAEDAKRIAQLQTLDNIAYIAGEETAIGKAMLVVQQVLLAKKLINDVKAYIQSVQLKASEAAVTLTTGSANAAATLNPGIIVAYAAQAISIYRNIRKALKAGKQNVNMDGGGGNFSAPTGPTRRAESVNVENADEIQNLSTQPAVKAYVVSGDVRSSQEAEAKIATRRTLD